MSTTLNGFTFTDSDGLNLATNSSGDIGIRVYQPYNSWGSCYVFIDTSVAYDSIDNTATITINGATACHDSTTCLHNCKMYGTLNVIVGDETIEIFNLTSSTAWKLVSSSGEDDSWVTNKNSPKAMSNVEQITTAKIPCNEDGTCTVTYSGNISVSFPLGTGNTFKMTDCPDTLSTTLVYEHTHDYSNSVVTPPTCAEKGYTTHFCTICDASYIGNYVDALGHTYEGGICSVCGEPAVYPFKKICYIYNGENWVRHVVYVSNKRTQCYIYENSNPETAMLGFATLGKMILGVGG